MNNQTKWISVRIRVGWIMLAAGAIMAILGRFVEQQYAYLPYNLRIIAGLGILIASIGVGYLIRYGPALKDEKSARQLSAQERDERTVLIRARAGNRAYWVSATLIYAGLMWASYAANGGLPDLNGDVLWYFLAACVIIPLGVYVASSLVDERYL